MYDEEEIKSGEFRPRDFMKPVSDYARSAHFNLGFDKSKALSFDIY
jgi:hypothetical protein